MFALGISKDLKKYTVGVDRISYTSVSAGRGVCYYNIVGDCQNLVITL